MCGRQDEPLSLSGHLNNPRFWHGLRSYYILHSGPLSSVGEDVYVVLKIKNQIKEELSF